MGDIMIHHENVVRAYQERLSALTHENIHLALVCQKLQQQLADLSTPSPGAEPPGTDDPTRKD